MKNVLKWSNANILKRRKKKIESLKPDDESDMMKVTKNITGKQKKILRTPMGKSNKWPSNVYF